MNGKGRAMKQSFPSHDQRVNIIDILDPGQGIQDQAKDLTEGDF